MKIPEHLAMSYLLAQLGPQQEYGAAGTALVMAAGMLPDLDGVSILGGWKCHLQYHRKVGHGLPVTLLGPLALAWLGSLAMGQALSPGLWAWLQLSLLLHLAVDLLFYRWRVQLLWPLSGWGVGLGLVGWNDLVPTLVLYAACGAALVFPAAAVMAAAGGLALVGLHVAWRAWDQRPVGGWLAWLMRDWACRSPRVWLWLTGDFVSR